MSTPIRIFQHEQLGLAVSGRELYTLITRPSGSRDIFADWFKDRIGRFSLVNGKDYLLSQIQLPNTNRRKVYEYTVSLEAAKRLAEWQPAKRGLGVLTYIREYERNPIPIDTATQSTTETTWEESTTSTIALHTESQSPRLNLDEALPELEKLKPGPAPMPLQRPIASIAPVNPLSPIQHLLQEVQKLADAEKNREKLPSEVLSELDNRVKAIEKKLNAVVFFFQQSANALANFTPTPSRPEPAVLSTPPTKSQSMRSKIVRLVEAWSAFHKITHQEVWQWLYNRLFLQYRFDAYSYGKLKRDPNYLDIVEEHGQLENLYAIADSSLKTS